MRLPAIKTIDEMYELVDEVGFLPYFSCEVPGFSLMDITRAAYWWSDDPVRDPWQWRIQAATEGRVAYGKFFHSKAGFISKEWLPVFANFRRDGYDYDSLYEEGKASHKSKLIMDLFSPGTELPSFEVKRLAGFVSGGEKGYDGAVASLQMQMYLTICGFEQKRNKRGERYGWPVGVLTTMEDRFGYDHVRSLYCEDPKVSRDRILDRIAIFAPTMSDKELIKFIK